MTLFARIGMILGAFLIVAGLIYGAVTGLMGPQKEWEGFTLILTVAGGALLIGSYFTRAVQRARERLAAEAAGAGAGDSEPHVAPTIWPLIFALSMIGLVIGAVESRWALVGGGVLLVAALAGWSLDIRRQWRHHDHTAGSEATHGGPGAAHSGAGQ
ncbi:MAG: cytochrome c oxidase subunit 4 [Actinobacteria bacterium]|nr:cytochrome c oxidase subunit 4 [Actinomycetota bacterium]MBO0786934.1 cytochrome c oxidase subunit 4 [Actinomycetota bacterium]